MKHLKWIVGLLLLAVVPGLAVAQSVDAQRFATRVDKDVTVQGSVYSFGAEIDIRGTINGDIFCGGQTVHIDATVNGDVICSAQDVTISGRVNGDVRVAGQNVSIDADVARSATVAALTFSLDAPAKVGQDLTIVGDSHRIKGTIGRDLIANSAGSIIVSGDIGRHMRADATAVELKRDASIAGNLTYTSGQPANVAGMVRGETERIYNTANPWPGRIRMFMFALSGMLLITMVLAFLFPRALHRTSDRITKRLGMTALIGAITAIVTPILAVGLMMLLFGIPLGILLLLAYLVALILSIPVAGYYVGRIMLKEKATNPLITGMAGTAVIVVLSFIPFVGVFVSFASVWAGLGALVLALKSQVNTSYRPS